MKNPPYSQSRVVLVTGCSRGLGRAMVEGFIARGDTVIGCARHAQSVADMSVTHPSPHFFEALDIANDQSVEEFSERAMKLCGAPDLLINNAGVINANAPLWQVPAEEFSRVIDVNLGGVANVIRHFVPAMIQRGSGVIVNFSSGWGRSTSPEVAPYCATKWGIEGLTQALAQELPDGLAAVALNPGIIDTDMLRSCFGGDAGSYAGPEAWAEMAVPFLAGLGEGDNGRALTAP